MEKSWNNVASKLLRYCKISVTLSQHCFNSFVLCFFAEGAFLLHVKSTWWFHRKKFAFTAKNCYRGNIFLVFPVRGQLVLQLFNYHKQIFCCIIANSFFPCEFLESWRFDVAVLLSRANFSICHVPQRLRRKTNK